MFKGILISLCLILLNLKLGISKMEGFVAGGTEADIRDFPHSAHLRKRCVKNGVNKYGGCGASILSKDILLTSAHCFNNCEPSSGYHVRVGSADINKGQKYHVSTVKVHPKFRKHRNDIAILKLNQSLQFSSKVKAIVIQKDCHFEGNYFKVAGWGQTDKNIYVYPDHLQMAKLKSWPHYLCELLLAPASTDGIFCGGDREQKGKENDNPRTLPGDSGSAVVMNNMQVGIVMGSKNGILIFVNVPYHYDWIMKTVTELCKRN